MRGHDLSVSRDIAPSRQSIEQGYTLPASWYGDPGILALERGRIFDRTWQYVAPAGMVATPGAYYTSFLGFLPIVISRGEDGQLHGFANVCQHRGMMLAEGCGQRKLFQCRYHAWTYNLDGSVNRAPGFDASPDFDPSEFHIPKVQVAEWGPFVFANVDPKAVPFADYVGPEFMESVSVFGPDLSRLRLRERREYPMKANWKVVTENYLECYHCANAHPSFASVVDLKKWHFEYGDNWSAQGGPLRGAAGGEKKVGYASTVEVEEGRYYFVWPNFGLVIHPGPGNVTTNVFLPVGETTTNAIYEFFYSPDVSDADAIGITDLVDQIQQEDIDLTEGVQQGLSSGGYRMGKLNLSMADPGKCEQAVHHFQRLAYQALEDAAYAAN